ncbi:uncharacterized protein KY384_003739 [Bacidia gigantensis]|uniref:uncharacterized protein n=1 Tax=Bacidia gigantensis TaxID=2732470 RepID=UPI001D0466DA|nr:uncharacterized protein KY384_003739 [Bacidia gigantensis]KAG8532102.1 hypothetical protein KY384_003739 [Bacidia gigantensis]
MRRRVTFIIPKGHDFDEKDLLISQDKIHIKNLQAAREDRITLSISQTLRMTNALKRFFSQPSVLSERFASSASFQYYQGLLSSTSLSNYIEETICSKKDSACRHDAERIKSADYFDIDYDTISQSFTFTAYFGRAHPVDATGQITKPWNEYIGDFNGSVATEIGILSSQKSTEPEELSLGGSLVQLSKDTRSMSSRSLSTFSTNFVKPTGLHPTLRLTFPRPLPPPAPTCGLLSYLTLPSTFFVDKYQISSTNFLASNNLKALRALSGETDLEAPEWATSQWGSAMLLELAPSANAKGAWSAEIPLQLRYSSSDSSGISNDLPGQVQASVPWPAVFWACPAEEGTKMSVNPFDRVSLGYDGLFGPRTMFYHLRPLSNDSLVEKLSVPVLDLGETQYVASTTILAVMASFLWASWLLARSLYIREKSRSPTQAKKDN